MKCKVFFGDTSTNIEASINKWLEDVKNISIENICADKKRIYIFYSDRKGKLDNLNEL